MGGVESSKKLTVVALIFLLHLFILSKLDFSYNVKISDHADRIYLITPSLPKALVPATASKSVAPPSFTTQPVPRRKMDAGRLEQKEVDAPAVAELITHPPAIATEAERQPSLDIEKIKKSLRSHVDKTALQTGDKPPEKTMEAKLAQSIEKAARPDCKKDYADMGLLAALPMAYGAISDKGCKW